MAKISPFRALRPDPDLAGRICELPYDVMNREEAVIIAKDNPYSFLHVSRPEIDYEPIVDAYSDSVYAKGFKNFQLLREKNALIQDQAPYFYLYQQIMGSHSQIGLVAVASCDEYDSGTIKKHELTRPRKENDRVKHIETLNAQTGPVFLTYRAESEIDTFVEQASRVEPVIDFTSEDKVRHSSWIIRSQKEISFLREKFSAIECLYIADGHHRSAAASRVSMSRGRSGQSGQFLVVVFPHNQMQILSYNRIVKSLNGMAAEEFISKLGNIFIIRKEGNGYSARKNEIGFYFKGEWSRLVFKDHLAKAGSLVEELDVALLQNHVLEPLLGIDDPRTNDQIDFVGGIRGPAELKRLVDQGQYECAFSLYPTSIEDLMGIADANDIMPPKSTWFEPKLRDGMFSYLI